MHVARTELRIFYGVVLILALFGQASGASSWLIPPDAGRPQLLLYWFLVIGFVAVLELGAVVLLRRAETQRRAGERAGAAIFTAVMLALAAAAITWVSHWGPAVHEQLQSWAFAGSTLLGVIVWAIMADLRIAEHVAQRRAVREAVRRYIKALSMDPAEKAVLLATVNIPLITRWIIEGPDAVEGAGHDRDIRIARILATAIDPNTWHGAPVREEHKAAAITAFAETEFPEPAPVLPFTPVDPKPPKRAPRRTRADFSTVQELYVELFVRHGKAPSLSDLAAPAETPGRSTIYDWMRANPATITELKERAEKALAAKMEGRTA